MALRRFDTSDFIRLKASQQSAFDDMWFVIEERVKALKAYCEKEVRSQSYIDRENKFLATVSDYVNITESLLNEMQLHFDEYGETVTEALDIITQANEEIEKHMMNGAK